jgi:uncharacterized protein DUF1064
LTKRCKCPTPRVRINKGKFYCLDCEGHVSATNKYGAEKAGCGKHLHDSGREAQRCRELQQMQRGGLICSLETYPKYELVVGAVKICNFIPDFRYRRKGVRGGVGDIVLEDCKSRPTMTPVYRLKKKLLKAIYDLDVEETF